MTARKMGPLDESHPCVQDRTICAGCHKLFAPGDYVTLVPIGPGDDIVERAKCRAGEVYNAVATVAHWGCVTGKLDHDA